MSDSEGGDALFGDEENQDQSLDNALGFDELSDQDDDGDRDRDHSRRQDYDDADEDQEGQEVKLKHVMGVMLHRHRIPRASKDGNGFLQTMKVPKFLKLQAEEYKPDTYEPTEWDIQNARSEQRKNVVRFKRDPDTGELQSNANIYRWSDGSLTLSVGTDHYEIQKKTMAPSTDKQHYEERDDAHYYVAAAHFTSELFMTVGHVSEQYSVNLPSNLKDEAIMKFNREMEAAARAKRQGADMIFTTTKDPELQKREAELAEKERMKAQRRQESAAARLDGRSGGYKSGGLSIRDLEGGRRASGPRKRGAPGASKGKRRRPEYDSDDDFAGGGGRQNEYDREDDFIAPSDDEEGGSEEDEEEDDLLDDDEEEEVPRKKRQKTAEAEDADADADADLDDVDVTAANAESSHRRRRHIIDEDEDEDEE
ncbi:Leo1-like protein-domain-containing protein [Hypoxylon trugodes]|uniref:Leo1-like protein-domain-containing protein n=1 Tax=Hypoxylon trugodes TaxID=326681 RepID=UPI0021A16EA6|nr:Leo1-like protein-domain-containing protein [Hypoxylon trugodes]KAI1383469.1 Leo1-like protein-domain-containing protein [Hypoxylon trugodes]